VSKSNMMPIARAILAARVIGFFLGERVLVVMCKANLSRRCEHGVHG